MVPVHHNTTISRRNASSFLVSSLVLFQLSVCVAQQNAYESPAGTKFLLYTPPGYLTSTGNYPLLLSLHSKGEVSYDITELTSNNPEQMPCRLIYLNKWPQDLPFIVLTPQLKPEPDDDVQWPAAYIDEVVRYVLAHYRIDLNRIYLTGISRGGTGTWTYASAYPEKIAAIVTLSGRSDVSQACAISDIPVWAFHGDGDAVAPTQYSIDMVNAVNACNPGSLYNAHLTLLRGREHNGWNEVYNGSSEYRIYDWLLMFSKNNRSNKKPYVTVGPDLRIQLRNEPLHLMSEYFDSDGQIANAVWTQTSGAQLSLTDTHSPLLEIKGLKTGTFEFTLTVTDDKGAQSSDKLILEVTNSAVTPAVTQLILVNGKTDQEVGRLSEGQVINTTALGVKEINIRAVVSTGTASVRYSLDRNENLRSRNGEPYFVVGQTTSPEWEIKNGVYSLCATPYPQTYERGAAGISLCYTFTVTDKSVSDPCAGAGKIIDEIWNGIPGTTISSIPANTAPSSTRDLNIFEAPADIGDNYGSRMRGYLCVPVSGNYTFWISGNDRTELWLSTDQNPGNKRLIAYAERATNPRQWDKYGTQQSPPTALSANQKYYVEVLHKEGTGSDHVAVGWQLPDGTLERPIPGMRLIPFDESAAGTTPVVNITSPAPGETFTAPATIAIAANASVAEGTITKVEFYNGTTKLGEDPASPYSFTWNNVAAGDYTLRVTATNDSGQASTTSVSVRVTPGSTTACANTGTILRELWTDVPHADVASIPVNTSPDAVTELTSFEDPTNAGDNYGTRVSGYLCVPATGKYTFWIASNDQSELWLSTNADPVNAVRIGYVPSATNVRQWNKFETQQSIAVNLVAGQQYYVEALHKEGIGSDHMAVAWQLPDGTLEQPIPGNRLSPYERTDGGFDMRARLVPTGNMATDESLRDLAIYPNPAQSNADVLVVSGVRQQGAQDVRIEIMRITGQLVYAGKINCDARCDDYMLPVNGIFTPGVYVISVINGNNRVSKRLMIR